MMIKKKKPRGDVINHSGTENLELSEYTDWLWERLEWAQDQKFGLFMHWGIYSVWGICESWPLVPADTWARGETMKPWIDHGKDLESFSKDYRALNKMFNPVKFSPEVWAKEAKNAGMKYVCFTTKHHDGFCMWDTKTTDYKITGSDCPFHDNPRANVTREVFNTFRKEGLGIWCYFSKSDWHVPYYWSPDYPLDTRNPNYDTAEHPDIWDKFVDYTQEQMRELLTDYGKIDCLWLDGGQVGPPRQDIRMDEIADFGRRLQPGLLIADRTVGGKHENFITPEQTVPDEPLGHPWESCVTMGTAFSYRFDEEYKSTRTLIHLLVDVVCKGGNLLLNVAPSPLGEFDETAIERLREIGTWMGLNGEAIYGTRPVAPYKEGNICFTSKKGNVYAIILEGEGEDQPGKTVTLSGLTPSSTSPVRMLGIEKPLEWRMQDGKAIITLPRNNLPGYHAWTLIFRPSDD